MVLKRAVILKIYYMPNGPTSLIHKQNPKKIQGCWGKMKNNREKKFKERPSKVEKGYFQVLVKQTVVSIYHSFKARISDTISSFKWEKIVISNKNRHLPNAIIWNLIIWVEWSKAGLMLARRQRRWTNVSPALSWLRINLNQFQCSVSFYLVLAFIFQIGYITVQHNMY